MEIEGESKRSNSQVLPLSRIQKLIGLRMQQSKQSKPCFYIEAKADVSELLSLRPKLRKRHGTKITTNAFYIRTLGLAGAEFPLMLGRIEGGTEIKIPEHINVGFAVNAPHGLLVPVLKNVEQKGLADIALLEKQLTEQARDNELSLEQLEDETIALSNLGAYGIDSFVGIVPPRTTTILAVGNALRQVVPVQGRARVRKVVCLTISVDSRVVDSSYASRFLAFIKQKLENPIQLVE